MKQIHFIKKYLKYKKTKKVVINMYGIINIKLEIYGFDFFIYKNLLYLKENNSVKIIIDFNEASKIYKIRKKKILINFNFNEKLIIE